MSNLQKLPPTLDSREVAEMVGKTHAHLCRDIAGYAKALTESNFGFSDFFIEASYKDASGKSNKRYDITKQGCEMVANKLTGKKGILFTAEYVKRFNQMEEADRQPRELTGRELMAKALIEAQAVLAEKDKRIEEMRPKEIFADAVSVSKTDILIGDLAKLIKQNGHDIGQKRLFAWLREKGYLIKRKGLDWNMPTQKAMEMKLFRVKETVVTHSDGHTTVSKTPKVTGKGQVYFVNKFLAR